MVTDRILPRQREDFYLSIVCGSRSAPDIVFDTISFSWTASHVYFKEPQKFKDESVFCCLRSERRGSSGGFVCDVSSLLNGMFGRDFFVTKSGEAAKGIWNTGDF